EEFVDDLIARAKDKGWYEKNGGDGVIWMFFAHDHQHELGSVFRASTKKWISSSEVAVLVDHDISDKLVVPSLRFMIENNLMMPSRNGLVLAFGQFPRDVGQMVDGPYRGIVWKL